MLEELVNKSSSKEGIGRRMGERKGNQKEVVNSAVTEKADGSSKLIAVFKNNSEELISIMKVITEVNKKSLGREITFRDLALFAIPKLTQKDLEKIQDQSLSDMERVQKLLDEHNDKNKTQISMGEFLVKRLNLGEK